MRTLIHLGTVITASLVVIGIMMNSDECTDNPKGSEEKKIFALLAVKV